MQTKPFSSRALAMFAGAALLVISQWAAADPPSRVGRIGYLSGAVSFSPAGENDWAQAAINRPLTTGDRLWTDARARAEIQVGGAMIRLDAFTGVTVLNLDDRITQLQLTQGTMNVRVRRFDSGQTVEVDTPNLAFTLRQAGEYRIEVDADGNATTIFVRRGQGEAWGDNAAYILDASQPYRFMGTDLRDMEYVDAPRLDEFDRWSGERDRRYDNSASARYVSPDVVGYQDLDANGTWRRDATYGNVWYPSRVSADWAPYRDGHWAWIDPWGWTWVDDAPWGFAVSHYGRWANVRGAWGWIPGPVQSHAYYAPALVAFVGGNNLQLSISGGNVGGVAWFPLAPREVYRPAYAVSRGYFENINRSNTVVNTTVINNTYNNTNVTNVVYVNRQVKGAVVAMPAAAFVQSQRVSAAVRMPVEPQAGTGTPVSWIPALAPTEKSVHGAAAQAGKPPARTFERPVIARTAPPPVHAGFAAQQPQLAAKPGRPLEDAARQQLKPAANVPAPVVNVIRPTQQAPVVVPPTAATARRPDNARGAPPPAPAATPAPPASPASPAATGAPPAPPRVMPPQATPPAVPPAPVGQRGRPDERKAIPPATPAAPAPPAPVGKPETPPPRAVQPQPAPSTPPVTPNEQRGRPGDRNAAPPAVPAVPAAPAKPDNTPPRNVQPPSVPPAAPGAPAGPRGKAEEKIAPPPAPVNAGAPEAPPRAARPQPMPPPVPSPVPGASTEQRGRPDARDNAPPRVPNVAPPIPAPTPRPAPPVVVPAPAVAPPPVPAPPQRAPRAMPEPPRAVPPPAQVQPPQPEAKGRPANAAADKATEKADAKKKEKEDKDAKDARKREEERKQKD